MYLAMKRKMYNYFIILTQADLGLSCLAVKGRLCLLLNCGVSCILLAVIEILKNRI